MANYCSNTIILKNEEDYKKLSEYLTRNLTSTKEGIGKYFEHSEQYFSDLYCNPNDNVILYETRWTPIIKDLIEISKILEISFEMLHEEPMALAFGKILINKGNMQYYEVEHPKDIIYDEDTDEDYCDSDGVTINGIHYADITYYYIGQMKNHKF